MIRGSIFMEKGGQNVIYGGNHKREYSHMGCVSGDTFYKGIADGSTSAGKNEAVHDTGQHLSEALCPRLRKGNLPFHKFKGYSDVLFCAKLCDRGIALPY